jgi:hypothetical protein
MTGRIPATAARLVVALLASTAVMAASAGAAGAATIKTPFTAEYSFTELTEGGFGTVACEGKRQVNATRFAAKGWPTSTRDVEKCRSTEASGKFIGLKGGETGEWFPGASGWDSDFDGAAAVSAAYTVNSGDKAFKLIAYYPAS